MTADQQRLIAIGAQITGMLRDLSRYPPNDAAYAIRDVKIGPAHQHFQFIVARGGEAGEMLDTAMQAKYGNRLDKIELPDIKGDGI